MFGLQRSGLLIRRRDLRLRVLEGFLDGDPPVPVAIGRIGLVRLDEEFGEPRLVALAAGLRRGHHRPPRTGHGL